MTIKIIDASATIEILTGCAVIDSQVFWQPVILPLTDVYSAVGEDGLLEVYEESDDETIYVDSAKLHNAVNDLIKTKV